MLQILLTTNMIRIDKRLCGCLIRAAVTEIFGEHALLTKNILVKDGGQRRVRDTDLTVWGNGPQKWLLMKVLQKVCEPFC